VRVHNQGSTAVRRVEFGVASKVMSCQQTLSVNNEAELDMAGRRDEETGFDWILKYFPCLSSCPLAFGESLPCSPIKYLSSVPLWWC
jgi:hypothetical protein